MNHGKAALLVALAGFTILITAVVTNRKSVAPTIPQVEVPKPPPPAPLPWGVDEALASQYRSQAKFVIVQVHIGYNSNGTVKQQVANRWPSFGEVIKTEDMGPMLDGDGTVIKATVRKYDIWD